ncbi:MAG: MBL fold metallo-hydrolase [Nitrospirae bacterium CG08_land_8_20_14_0_20_52_24]|nr:MAG: MBL fold metallo-hydrolase [Nitrospirae bacterium CG08_land_8_20_14_0_20_52_24]
MEKNSYRLTWSAFPCIYNLMTTDILIGDFRCILLDGGTFRVDGGAMFGVAPKVLWEKKARPDAKNRVTLSMNPLLILAPGLRILVDPGIGEREAGKFGEHYAVLNAGNLEQELARSGVRPEEIDIVINTHLHWDHSGAGIRLLSDGGLVPMFPNAVYLVQQGEWESACRPDEWTRASYVFQGEPVLIRTGQMELLHGEAEIVPGVRVIRTPGHTPFHQSVLIESGGEALLYVGDLIPMAAHMRLPYITSLDQDPSLTLRIKRRILKQGGDMGWTLAFCHEPEKEKRILPCRKV